MPPIIQDSEDEDDNEDFTLADGVVLADEANGRQEKSSLSTGSLNRQIADAGRGLFNSASDQYAAAPYNMHSSTTPATKKAGRRHTTTMTASEPPPVPNSSTKRMKSTAIMQGSKGQQEGASQDGLAAFQPDFLPDQSQLPLFSDHSRSAERSSALPAGTIQQNFLQHEPNVMFQNSGSTTAYNESSEQRLIEHAMLQNQENVPPAVADIKLTDSDAPDSSLFPWSQAVPTQTPKLDDKQQDVNSATQTAMPNKDNAASQSQSMNAVPDTGESLQAHVEEVVLASKSYLHIDDREQQPPNSSPIVSVPRVSSKSAIADADLLIDSHGSRKGKKRKAEVESSEPLNSEDLAIGLPKERYQPRPSRRRSAAVPETSIDYSVVPEKAAKKRRKTVNPTADNAQTGAGRDTSSRANSADSQSLKSRSQSSEQNTNSDKAFGLAGSDQVAPTPPTRQPEPPQQPLDRGQARETLKDLGFMLRSTQSSDAHVKPSPGKAGTPTSAKLHADAAAFAMPPPSSQASKRSRRSHTTIFEDHIDLSTVQKSPSLSQQQAKRQATLEPVEHESSQSTRQKHKKGLPKEDDDDEDELSKDYDQSVTKKRGRPAKSKADKATKSAEQVLDDPDVDSNDDDVVQPKKRGRPAKVKPGKVKSAEKVLDGSEGDSADEDIVRPKKRGPAGKTKIVEATKSTAKVLDESEIDGNDEDVIQSDKRAPPAGRKFAGKRNSTKKVLDDSEAESDEDNIVVPAKKTGRATNKAAFKSAEKVQSDSDANVEEDDEEPEEDEPPKKKPSGKPTKSISQEKAASDHDSHRDSPAKQPAQDVSKSKSADAGKDVTPSERPPAAVLTKPATLSAVDKPLPKPNPNSHSPIKPSSKVLHRVGLNRTQRVQPLLKIVRPPAPARKR